MATIRKRGDKYHVQIRKAGYPTQSNSFKSKTDAQAWATTVEAEMVKGMFEDKRTAKTTNIGELIDRYSKEEAPKKKTCRTYLWALRALKDSLGAYTLATLRPDHIAAYRDSKLDQGLSAEAVTKQLNILSHVIDTSAREWGIAIPSNPVKLTKRPKLPRGRARRLKADEIASILENIPRSQGMRDIIALALETGMRRGEIAAIRREDIDMDIGLLHIPETKTDIPRTIPLTRKAREILVHHSPKSFSDRVFPVQPDSITCAFNRACERAGVKNAHFHDLRHEAISRLFEKGLSIPEVATISGHQTWAMLKRYTHMDAVQLGRKLEAYE